MTPSLSATALLSRLQERYATKLFDSNTKLDDETWAALEQVLVLTPSSFGLQPWKFLVIQDPAVREQMLPHCWGQRQVVDASHLLVLTVKTSIDEPFVDAFIQSICATRGITPDLLDGYKGMMVGSVVQGMNAEQQLAWATKQAYIALGNFMTSAALLGVDTCPMEGFVPAEINRILGLADQGLSAVLLCPAGFRSDDDKYALLPKVRAEVTDVIQYV